MIQDDTTQYSVSTYSTVQYSTVQYGTVQYSTVQYNTVQYRREQITAEHYVLCCEMRRTLHARTYSTYLWIPATTLSFPRWLTSVRSQFVISCPWNMGEEKRKVKVKRRGSGTVSDVMMRGLRIVMYLSTIYVTDLPVHFNLKGTAVPVCLEPCKVVNKSIIGTQQNKKRRNEEKN